MASVPGMSKMLVAAILVLIMMAVGIYVLQEILSWVDHCAQGGIGDGGAYCFHRGGNS